MWFIGVEVEQETSAPPPKKNPGSAPDRFFSPYKSLYFECYATMSMFADAHISSLGYLWLKRSIVAVVVVSPSQLSSFPLLSYCACAAARFASVFIVH